jgi:uncharacterized protein (TIRG00374 family)
LKIRRALLSFIGLTILYLCALVWADTQKQIFSGIAQLLSILFLMAIVSFLSYLLRFARWQWLLKRSGHDLNVIPSFLAYLSGFAFTASPGKVGELIRIRYLSPLGVPSWRTISAFIYERFFDLLAVLLLSSLYIRRMDIFIFAFCFVALLFSAILLLAYYPKLILSCAQFFYKKNLIRITILISALGDGLAGSRVWINPLDILIALFTGVLTWGLTSLSFVYLLNEIGVSIPTIQAISIYPISMLAGAVSMIPGGLGSTEGAIIAILYSYGVGVSMATLAAVGIRLSTLWFSIFCGFIALIFLELKIQNSR